MAMVNHSRWNIPGTPTEKPRAHAEIGVVAECEERFIETAGFFEDLPVIHRGACIGPKDFFRPVVLSDVGFHRASAAVLPVPVDQMSDFVDNVGRILKKDLAREHSHSLRCVAVSNELFEPGGLGTASLLKSAIHSPRA